MRALAVCNSGFLMEAIADLMEAIAECLCFDAAWEFILRCCTVSERPPHFLLVSVAASAPGDKRASDAGRLPVAESGQQQRQRGQQLQAQLQHVGDSYRRTDIAAARERQEQQVRGNTVWQGGAQALLSCTGIGTRAWLNGGYTHGFAGFITASMNCAPCVCRAFCACRGRPCLA